MNQRFGAQRRHGRRWVQLQQRRGFTVIEVLIALFLLAITAALVTRTTIHSMKTQDDALHATQAALVAREEADRLAAMPEPPVTGEALSPIPRPVAGLTRRLEAADDNILITIGWDGPTDPKPSLTLATSHSSRSARR